jgi:hypothetical protein
VPTCVEIKRLCFVWVWFFPCSRWICVFLGISSSMARLEWSYQWIHCRCWSTSFFTFQAPKLIPNHLSISRPSLQVLIMLLLRILPGLYSCGDVVDSLAWDSTALHLEISWSQQSFLDLRIERNPSCCDLHEPTYHDCGWQLLPVAECGRGVVMAGSPSP